MIDGAELNGVVRAGRELLRLPATDKIHEKIQRSGVTVKLTNRVAIERSIKKLRRFDFVVWTSDVIQSQQIGSIVVVFSNVTQEGLAELWTVQFVPPRSDQSNTLFMNSTVFSRHAHERLVQRFGVRDPAAQKRKMLAVHLTAYTAWTNWFAQEESVEQPTGVWDIRMPLDCGGLVYLVFDLGKRLATVKTIIDADLVQDSVIYDPLATLPQLRSATPT